MLLRAGKFCQGILSKKFVRQFSVATSSEKLSPAARAARNRGRTGEEFEQKLIRTAAAARNRGRTGQEFEPSVRTLRHEIEVGLGRNSNKS